ncbi:MAG: AarF/ABC1/UbiB kinase family protein, partial [Acidobacteria bacterium]|nr:AarF/ABC1/UbiB kinase family protein [Acidobacteriota bacterium]
MSEARSPGLAIDRRRYRRVRRFFLGVALHIGWWDLFLNLPALRFLRRDPLPRWRRLAHEYRELAVEMGGVLIKLGQYLSTRVDVLPLEVTRALSGLQDEVPEEPFEAIAQSIEEDLGRPLGEVFETVNPKALGAASLA